METLTLDASVRNHATDDVLWKIDRLSTGAKPRVVDLFSGCGGISLGFQRAGFEIVAGLELDALAAASHARNIFRHRFPTEVEHHAKPIDVTKLEPEALVERLGLGSPRLAVDVLVGGPPCQAYARVGRAKLREVAAHPDAYKVDPRGNLYLRYLTYVERLSPLALVIENVPDILHYGGHNIMEEIAEALEDMGYHATYSLINSAFHGVPQTRDRVFMIAIRRELQGDIRFPRATHHLKLPSGYAGTRAVALKHVNLFDGGHYMQPDLGEEALPGPVTARQAIGDLPPITGHLDGTLHRGARRFETFVPYRQEATATEYALQMRTWPGAPATTGVYDHVIRSLPRDSKIFQHMPAGGQYPEAHRVAEALFAEEAERLGLDTLHPDYAELRKKRVPPYRIDTFPNRWWKMRADSPVRTLMAHIGKDTYSHIHYDSDQARTISVREAARLQSFPDCFVFSGTMNPAFRQIGNAVPPLMAFRIAECVRAVLP